MGVIAVVIGADTVEGVVGIGIDIVFGVLFSSSPTTIFLEGVLTSDSLFGRGFCDDMVCEVF